MKLDKVFALLQILYNTACFASGGTTCSVLQTTDTVEDVLIVVVAIHIGVVVVNAAGVGVVGIVLRSSPPEAVPADTEETASGTADTARQSRESKRVLTLVCIGTAVSAKFPPTSRFQFFSCC